MFMNKFKSLWFDLQVALFGTRRGWFTKRNNCYVEVIGTEYKGTVYNATVTVIKDAALDSDPYTVANYVEG